MPQVERSPRLIHGATHIDPTLAAVHEHVAGFWKGAHTPAALTFDGKVRQYPDKRFFR